MAIVEEFFEIAGESHVRHYSDSGLMIASDDGVEYEIAEDFTYLNKVYHETSTPVDYDSGDTGELSGAEVLRALEGVV